jgi:hypothetical protein
MNWRNSLAAAAAMVLSVIAGWGMGQAASSPKLSAQDYIEIQELNSKYARGFDLGERDGAVWAETFTSDGVFVSGGKEIAGHAALAAYADNFFKTRGKGTTRHWIGNLLLTPTPEGVQAQEYVLFVSTTSPATILSTVQYNDTFVKTSEGWRIKRRTLTSDPKPQ